MINIKDFCVISKIKNFEEIKHKILTDLDNRPKHLVRWKNFSYITDFHLADRFKNHSYVENLKESFDVHFEKINKEMNYKVVEIGSIWFQQYENNHLHSLHNHSNVTFTNIAYIELSNKSQGTVINFKDIDYQIDCNEGEIVSFPGFFNHRSSENIFNQRKTVIVVNTLHSGIYNSD